MKMLRMCALLVCCVTGLYGEAPKPTPVSREVRELRLTAANALAKTIPYKFISADALNDVLDKIDKLDPEAHARLLRIQARAQELSERRRVLEAMPDVTADSPELKEHDKKVVREVEKPLDDLLYNGGFFNYKSAVAFSAGLMVGTAKGVSANSVLAGVWRGFWVALLIELVLRGRRAILAGGAIKTVSFVVGVLRKFLSSLFDDTGLVDSLCASVEQGLRGLGKKLDTLFDNGPTMAVIVVATIAGVAIAYHTNS